MTPRRTPTTTDFQTCRSSRSGLRPATQTRTATGVPTMSNTTTGPRRSSRTRTATGLTTRTSTCAAHLARTPIPTTMGYPTAGRSNTTSIRETTAAATVLPAILTAMALRTRRNTRWERIRGRRTLTATVSTTARRWGASADAMQRMTNGRLRPTDGRLWPLRTTRIGMLHGSRSTNH